MVLWTGMADGCKHLIQKIVCSKPGESNWRLEELWNLMFEKHGWMFNDDVILWELIVYFYHIVFWGQTYGVRFISRSDRFLPGWYLTSLLHEGSQREPQRVEDAKVVGRIWRCLGVFGLILFIQVPLIRAEAADQEQDHTHTDVGEHDTHPYLIGQRVQEGEDTWFRLLGLLDHDGDAQRHEGLGEVDHFLTNQGYGERCHSYICSLETETCRVG